MDIREIGTKERWDGFVTSRLDYTFLNAWAWGSFQEALGQKIWRLGMFEDEELAGVALVVLVAARRGRFLFVPHGPMSAQSSKSKVQSCSPELKVFLGHLKDIAAQERCSFIRISPLLPNTPENARLFRDLRFRPAPMHMHAETTWVLNLLISEITILGAMRKTTRYLVRRGEKEDVAVTSGSDEKTLQDFYALYADTARRQRFVPFGREYIKKELEAFGSEGARVYLARRGGKIFAGAVVIFYGERAFYHHGASLHHPTASYLLQWRIIQDAKARGCREYNFWGVDFRPRHPWSGVTLFKTGFGGRAQEYLPAQDLALRLGYWVSYGIETMRRLWRRY